MVKLVQRMLKCFCLEPSLKFSYLSHMAPSARAASILSQDERVRFWRVLCIVSCSLEKGWSFAEPCLNSGMPHRSRPHHATHTEQAIRPLRSSYMACVSWLFCCCVLPVDRERVEEHDSHSLLISAFGSESYHVHWRSHDGRSLSWRLVWGQRGTHHDDLCRVIQ